MNQLPFSASPDAIAWIVESVRTFAEQRESAGMLPLLINCFNHRITDENGRTVEWFADEFFVIGWFRTEKVAGVALLELAIPGVSVYAHPEILPRLEGKQLRLETVDVGFPKPADKKRQLLTAGPNQGSPQTKEGNANGTS